MLSLIDRVSRQRSLKNGFVLVLALLVAALAIPLSGTATVLAQDDGAAAVDSPAPDAGAGAATDSAPAEVQSKNFLSWMIGALGWFWMLIFAALSFVMVALIMMNLLQVRREVLLPNDFVEEFEQKLNGKDFQGAYEIARNDDSFVARVLAAGMGRLSRGYPEAVEGMQEAGEDENMALEHRLSYLALIGTIAPMLGLMGTVQGMIDSFETISTSAVAPKPSELAEGISKALFTTLIGLMIAVPAMVFYSILKNRIQRLVLEIGMVSEGLMSRFAAVGKGQSGAKPA
ncbi:MAG: MotA/TolQ/ExbB proton channel family protein [Planctomycetaceae bacterium]